MCIRDRGNEAEGDVQITAFVSLHQTAAFVQSLGSTHIFIVQQKVIGKPEEQCQDNAGQGLDEQGN